MPSFCPERVRDELKHFLNVRRFVIPFEEAGLLGLAGRSSLSRNQSRPEVLYSAMLA